MKKIRNNKCDYPIRIPFGNRFELAIPLRKVSWEGGWKLKMDWEPEAGDVVSLFLVTPHGSIEVRNLVVEDNLLSFEDKGTLAAGTYDVDIRIVRANGDHYGCYLKGKLRIVQANDEAGLSSDTYEIEGAVVLYAKGGKGDDGVGIENVVLNPDNSFTFYFTDKTILTTDAVTTEGQDLSGYLTKVEADRRFLQTESDPTVPSWAKQQTKPTYNAGEVHALPDTTKFGYGIDLSLNTTTYVLTLALKDQDGNVLNTKNVDFPIESVVVNGRYDATSKKVVLELQNGTSIDIPVGDLIAGLQTEITSVNMLPSDLVDDTNSTHKFVTENEKQAWNNKSNFSGEYNDLNNKPVIPTNNNQLTNGAGYITSADIAGKEDKVAIITPELDNNNAFNATVGNYYKVTGNASAIDITLVTPSETSHLTNCIFLIDNSNGVGVSFHTQNLPFYQAANFAIATGKIYEVNALFNGTAWYLTQVEMEVQS